MTHRISNWTAADDRMVENAIRRGATRRELLNMLLMGGVALTAGAGVLTRATSAIAATPVKGGHIRAAGWSSSTSDTLDPAKASLSTDYVRCSAFYSRLTYLGEDGKISMELADSIESKDAKVWTVKLRKGVTFHDGKPLTSKDVVFSLKRHLDPAVGSKVNAIAKQMTGFAAKDDLTVEVTLASPNADFPTIMAIHQFMIVADGTTDFSKGNGTGAFVCKVFEPGTRSVAERNKNYFKTNGGPYLDSFEYIAITEGTARANALLSGDIQFASNMNAQTSRLLENNPKITLVNQAKGNYTDLNVRLDLDPGNKEGFATGLKYLINREAIKTSVLRGVADIANDQPVPPSSVYYNKELKAKPYDPEKAKSYFQKAGLVGKKVPIVTSDAATYGVEMAVLLQQSAQEIGMDFDIQRVPSDGYWSKYWLKAPVHFGNINPRPTPDILFSLLYTSDAPWNESQYKSPKFDAMVLEARGMLDEAKRTEMYHEMQRMIADEAATVIPVFMGGIDATTSKLKGLRPNPLGGSMGYAFAEYVWLES